MTTQVSATGRAGIDPVILSQSFYSAWPIYLGCYNVNVKKASPCNVVVHINIKLIATYLYNQRTGYTLIIIVLITEKAYNVNYFVSMTTLPFYCYTVADTWGRSPPSLCCLPPLFGPSPCPTPPNVEKGTIFQL